MAHEKLNDAPLLDQLEGQYEKFLCLIIYKLCGTKPVRITLEDMKKLQDDFAPGQAILFTHGHYDCIDFSIVTEERAKEIAAHQKTQEGRA